MWPGVERPHSELRRRIARSLAGIEQRFPKRRGPCRVRLPATLLRELGYRFYRDS
jgi:hypothetical protein